VWLRTPRRIVIVRPAPLATRPLTLRLTVQPSFLVSRVQVGAPWPAPGSRFAGLGTAIRQLHSSRPAEMHVTRPGRGRTTGTPDPGREVWSRAIGPSAPVHGGMASRHPHGGLNAVRMSLAAPVGSVVRMRPADRVPAETDGRTPDAAGRVEPRAFMPPPMVTRRAGGRSGRADTSVVPSMTGSPRLPSAALPDQAAGWPASRALPGRAEAAYPADVVAALTERVVQEIDGRVRARRERLGKV
jgi:hypothetical protein